MDGLERREDALVRQGRNFVSVRREGRLESLDAQKSATIQRLFGLVYTPRVTAYVSVLIRGRRIPEHGPRFRATLIHISPWRPSVCELWRIVLRFARGYREG